MKTIEEIDKRFCDCVAQIEDSARDLVFTPIVEFKLSEDIPKQIWDSIVYPGIYLIEIKNDHKFSSFP